MSDIIIIPAIIERVASRKDNTVTITLGTSELTPDKAGQIFSLNNKYVYTAIKVENFLTNEIDLFKELKAEDKEIKNPSKRLRNVFYRVWEADKQGFEDFDSYYLNQMEKLITHFKNKLC